jgi:hypothetical protein
MRYTEQKDWLPVHFECAISRWLRRIKMVRQHIKSKFLTQAKFYPTRADDTELSSSLLNYGKFK